MIEVRWLPSIPTVHQKLRTYRAIITWDQENDILVVEAVGHRRNVYDRDLPP